MCSLAGSLAEPETLRPAAASSGASPAAGSAAAPAADAAAASEDAASRAAAAEATGGDGAQAAPGAAEAAALVAAVAAASDEDGADGGLAELTWVECFHELRDEIWVVEAAGAVDSADPSAGEDSRADSPTPASALPPLGLMTLGNFEATVGQVPVESRLTAYLPSSASGDVEMQGVGVVGDVPAAPSSSSSSSSSGALLQVSAVPAVWNLRFDDGIDAPLVASGEEELGSEFWRRGKEGTAVLLARSAIQRSPVTLDWASAVWLCSEVGAIAVIVYNDLPDSGPTHNAFRMGLFGSALPPIQAFMINGDDGEALNRALREVPLEAAPLRIFVRSLQPTAPPSQTGVEDEASSTALPQTPKWPLLLRGGQDIAQAWSLLETVQRTSPSRALEARLADLAAHMGLAEKRVWLTRRLQRVHRGDTDAEELSDVPLAFVECDRNADQLQQLRKQLADQTGLGSPDVTGEFEVRFRDESSVGSAVTREWMDLMAQRAFLLPARHLLVSYDHGATFLPNAAAPFVDPHWRGDFELLGRLLGLALWHQVTLDLPLHPYICELLFNEGFPAPNAEEDAARLEKIDPELHRHKVRWLLSSDVDVSELGVQLQFTDTLLTGEGPSTTTSTEEPAEGSQRASESDAEMREPEADTSDGGGSASSGGANASALPPLASIVSLEDVLPGDERGTEKPWLRRFGPTEVTLVRGGEQLTVTEENKREYVAAFLEWRLRDSLRPQLEAMLKGFRASVPSEVLVEARRMLSADEVHALLAGSRDIDVADWERNTRATGGLTTSSREVRWFWQTVRQWAAEGLQSRLQDLLQFATGSRRVPVGGFSQLVGFNGGKHLFTLVRGSHLSAQSLPTSHACICTVDLPPWESLEAAQQKLLAAAESGRARFDEATFAQRGGGD
eukprot:TRINITY_DN29011_c0_g1_i1.p1 TRINITY_DN29011_c0_g1~~TRINITY_DN29011_c0_g1_i1.p1  ORF type:complete len:1011 (-),score=276.56 TRINITY_DN29011_c0_g1_i1:22-2727(-)